MAFTRITEDDLQGKGVIGQPEVPGLSTLEMQQSMEQIVREVAIPGINRLAEELEAATGAAGIGMERPAGMPEEVPAHVQGITAAHIEDRENPHGVTAAQVGAYTRQETDAAIDNKVVEIGAGDMAQAVYAANGEPGVVDTAVRARSAEAADDGVKLYTHTRSGTVHEFTGSGVSGRALMTADVQEGDTFSVNGQPVTAWMGAEDAAAMMAGQPYTGRWVSFVTEGDALNFKGGGGPVTVEGLSADVVLQGAELTVKQGAKTVKEVTGTLLAPAFFAGGAGDPGARGGAFGAFWVDPDSAPHTVSANWSQANKPVTSGTVRVRAGQTLTWAHSGTQVIGFTFDGVSRTGSGSLKYSQDKDVKFSLAGLGNIGDFGYGFSACVV